MRKGEFEKEHFHNMKEFEETYYNSLFPKTRDVVAIFLFAMVFIGIIVFVVNKIAGE